MPEGPSGIGEDKNITILGHYFEWVVLFQIDRTDLKIFT